MDPEVKLLEAFALQDGRWVLLGHYGGGDEIRVAPFDAIAFSALQPLVGVITTLPKHSISQVRAWVPAAFRYSVFAKKLMGVMGNSALSASGSFS